MMIRFPTILSVDEPDEPEPKNQLESEVCPWCGALLDPYDEFSPCPGCGSAYYMR